LIPLSLARIAEITRGKMDGASPETVVSGPVVIDSRQAEPGALFVAFRGEHADGHDFAAQAVEAGAAAVLAERPVGVPAIVVDDVLTALGALARAVIDRLPETTVIGVTGSAGKTSTKDLLARLTGRLGPAIAPPGSFNNEIGHPLTVLSADDSTRYLVLEMGARGLGHIAHLARVAPPDVGVVLNVGSAHIGEFGSRDVVAKAKGELVEALSSQGVAVLNADDPLVRTMAARTSARITLFGRAPEADVRAADESLDDAGRPRFTLVTPTGSVEVALRLYGAHTVSNALAAAAVAHELGMPVADIAEVLSEATPASRWRMEVTERPDGVTVINDAYNANPESVRSALDTLVHMARDRRSFAVLGEMAELGAATVSEHEKIGTHAARGGLTGLIAVGETAASVLKGAGQVGSWTGDGVRVEDADAAVAALGERLRPGDVVLVKGSRVAGLEKVAHAVLEMSEGGHEA
jgi:UDP-N-acetylmuramoyl-tripeptide--D-alanyl-D-alanine ligase